MSFSVAPKAGPTSEVQSTGHKTPEQVSARERAIARIKEGKPSGTISVVDKDPKAPIHIDAPMNLEKKPEEKQTLAEAVEATQSEAPVQDNINVESTEAPAAEAKPAESADKDPLSVHYAAMAKKEKAFRAKVQQQELALKAREEALAQREAATASKTPQADANLISKDDLKRDPWSIMQDLGITYDQLTEMALTSQSVPPMVTQQLNKLEKMLEEERSERRKQADDWKKQQEEQQTAAYKNAIESLKRDAASLVTDNPAYELIAANEASNDVVELIEQTFRDEKRVMTVEEAANEIEAYLEEEVLKLSKLKKIQSKLTPAQKVAEAALEAGQKEVKFIANKQSQPKTLTNNLGSTKPMSARERAILAMQGKLK